jgi:hypothetical protein
MATRLHAPPGTPTEETMPGTASGTNAMQAPVVQSFSQPSPETSFASSHCSTASSTPSPQKVQSALQVLPLGPAAVPGGSQVSVLPTLIPPSEKGDRGEQQGERAEPGSDVRWIHGASQIGSLPTQLQAAPSTDRSLPSTQPSRV